MKNSAIPFLVLFCLFLCCKKPHDPQDPGGAKKYPVNFTVSGFDQHREELGKTTDTLSDHIGHLYYVVFQQDNGYVHKIEQVVSEMEDYVVREIVRQPARRRQRHKCDHCQPGMVC